MFYSLGRVGLCWLGGWVDEFVRFSYSRSGYEESVTQALGWTLFLWFRGLLGILIAVVTRWAISCSVSCHKSTKFSSSYLPAFLFSLRWHSLILSIHSLYFLDLYLQLSLQFSWRIIEQTLHNHCIESVLSAFYTSRSSTSWLGKMESTRTNRIR